jgi:predicted RNase H-like nuclease (RuvC/YqgF family)
MPPETQPNATPEPEAGDETAQWADLAKELESPDLAETPATPAAEAKPQQAEPAEKEGKESPAEEKPKPTYEELEANYSNTQRALKAEREALKEERARLQRYDETLAALRERREQAKPEPKEEVKIPSRDEDPVGYFEHKLAEANAKIEALTEGTQQTTQQIAARQAHQQFWADVERSEQNIRKTTPDYDDACKHLESGRMKQLEVLMPDDSPAAQGYARQLGAPNVEAVRVYLLNQDRMAVAQMAAQMRVPAAQLYYNLAKQAGWQAPAASNVANLAIEAAKRGQSAAKTISGGGSRKAADDMGLGDLADLYVEDPDEFDRQWEKMARTGKLG